MVDVTSFAQDAGKLLDALGVGVIVAGFIGSTLVALFALFTSIKGHDLYRKYRHNLARSILLGLEFLVAGDIIRSVAGDLDLRTVVVLAIIVLIRSLISIEFETEIEGRWPWQRYKKLQKS